MHHLESRASPAALNAFFGGRFLGRRGARRPVGTFAEALLTVLPSGADPSAAVPRPAKRVVLRSTRVEDDLARVRFGPRRS